MKVQFEFDEKDIENNKERFEEIDERAKKIGLKKLSFGNYEGVTTDNEFASFFLLMFKDNLFENNCKKCHVWADKNNLYCEDVLKTLQEVKEVNNRNS